MFCVGSRTGDPSTLAEPFPKQRTAPSFHRGMAGRAESQSQVWVFGQGFSAAPTTLDSRIALLRSAQRRPEPGGCETGPALPERAALPASTPQTHRDHAQAFLWLAPPPLPTDPQGEWQRSTSNHCGKPAAPTPDLARAKEYFIYSSLTHLLSVFPFCQTETSWWLWSSCHFSTLREVTQLEPRSSHGSRSLNISLSSTLS